MAMKTGELVGLLKVVRLEALGSTVENVALD
jgi:hypothetical protein